jgi:hypothetical protein
MNLAADMGHHSGRATPSLRDVPCRQFEKATGRQSTYPLPIPVQTNPATSMKPADAPLNNRASLFKQTEPPLPPPQGQVPSALTLNLQDRLFCSFLPVAVSMTKAPHCADTLASLCPGGHRNALVPPDAHCPMPHCNRTLAINPPEHSPSLFLLTPLLIAYRRW